MDQDQKFLQVRVRRGGGTDFRFEEYRVPAMQSQTVLDVVTVVQRRFEPALAYRFACRVGVCESCAMTVNGMPRWTCRTHVRNVVEDGALTIEPLRNLPRIKDLATDMSGFFDKWGEAGNVFKGTATRHDEPARIDPASRRRQRADAAIECINCAVCYAACDVVAWNGSYLGPAALNRAWTLVNDDRHGEKRETRRAATGPDGCGSCHSQGNCTRACSRRPVTVKW